MESIEKRPLLIAGGWIQAAVVVLIFGFFILGVLTYYTYTGQPPIPDVVKTTNGSTLFTRADIMAGQQIFLSNGLMEYGSIFGHGAYLGPDFTAEYLHRAALSSIDFYGGPNSDAAELYTTSRRIDMTRPRGRSFTPMRKRKPSTSVGPTTHLSSVNLPRSSA